MGEDTPPNTEKLTEILSKFTALNNELLDAKRKLTKSNIALVRLQEELQQKNAMLEDALEHTKLAKQELEELNRDLESRVIERTKQLSMALKEIDDFAYSLSHDLRTPLRGIDGYSAILIEEYGELPEAEAKQFLQNIRNDAQHLGEVFDALHGLSNVSRKALNLCQVNLSELVQDIIAELQLKHPEIQIQSTIQPNLWANCDIDLIRTALLNLCSNAVKFSDHESIIRIEFGITEKDGVQMYYIKDNGIGFNMDYVNKLFRNFQRLHRHNDFQGIGIGLATVRRIINKHGGIITAYSTPSNGAVFYFTLSDR